MYCYYNTTQRMLSNKFRIEDKWRPFGQPVFCNLSWTQCVFKRPSDTCAGASCEEFAISPCLGAVSCQVRAHWLLASDYWRRRLSQHIHIIIIYRKSIFGHVTMWLTLIIFPWHVKQSLREQWDLNSNYLHTIFNRNPIGSFWFYRGKTDTAGDFLSL